MGIEIISFIAIIIIIFGFIKFNYKKCKTGGEKIIFIFYVIIITIPIIIYYLDLWNIPSKCKLTDNIDGQNWLGFIFNYAATIISSVIGVTASIYVVFIQIRKNNEDTEKRDKENLRLQNIPLLQFNCKEENSDENNLIIPLDSNVKDGVIQQINLSLKNIGLNTIRKSYIKINSEILSKEYCFQFKNQGVIEKNQEIIMPFLLKLFVDTMYKINLVIYYQDLLFNVYEQKVTLQYKVFPIFNGDGEYEYTYKFIIEDENKISEMPELNLDEL